MTSSISSASSTGRHGGSPRVLYRRDRLAADPLPGVPGLGPVGGGDPEPFQQHRVGEQPPDPAGELLG